MSVRFKHSSSCNGAMRRDRAVKCFVLVSLVFVVIGVSYLWLVKPVAAAAALTVTPITWNVVGLDSNNVAVGPNNFPVGVRVCNIGDVAATNLTATLVWDTSDSYISIRSGSQNPITWSSLAGGNTCKDFYFEVSITRDSNAYNHTRRYRITVTADGGISVASPVPREIFVEHLISQNRNATLDVKLDGVSIPVGGSMALMVGNSYNITLNASTATQGYEQIESFINFPNTIFRVNSVTTSYSANAATDTNAGTKLYADGCSWENNPTSPNYRACLSTGKYGGTVAVVYNVTIIAGAGTSQSLSTLIYDFSGSSYHYNSDYSTSTRIANIVGPSSVTIAKRFVPDSIPPGGTSQMMFTLNNPSVVAISGVTFTDTLSSGVSVAGTPGILYTGCGSGAFVGPPTGGATALTFQNGTIAANGSCIIKINVTASSVTTFNNTTGYLFINTTTNTGNTGSATLTVANATACTPGQTMAYWTVPITATRPPDNGAGAPSNTRAANVNTATASAFLSGGSLSDEIDTTIGVGDGTSWKTWGYKNNGQYVEFVIDTRHYTGVRMSFAEQRTSNGPLNLTIAYNAGSGLTNLTTVSTTNGSWMTRTLDFTGLTSASGNTTFRLTGYLGANNDSKGSDINYDNIRFTGCSNLPPPPTISKLFSPSTIPTNTVSTLTITISNTQTANEPLTNVTFSDPLPTGLEVASPTGASTTCAGASFTPSAKDTTLNFSLANMAAGATCTAQVNVKPTKAGQFDNVSGYIGATESGQNKTATGYATASLIAVAPPIIAKQFAASPIFVGNTTVLTFTLTNPNAATQLTGVQFSDTLPAGVTVGASSSTQCNGTLNTTATSAITLTNASINANTSCSFGVTVTGATAGVYTNTTGAVTSTNGGTGNTASASINVRTLTPAISLLKQIAPTSSGPWTPFTVRQVGENVYFQFTVENTGDTSLTSVLVKDPPGGTTVCNLGSLSVYTYTTCITGPVQVTTTDRITNTAQATSSEATSLTSSASHWTVFPTAVTLDRFGARADDSSLFALGIGGIVLMGVILWIAHRRAK